MKKLFRLLQRWFQGRPSHIELVDYEQNRFMVIRSDIKAVSIMDVPTEYKEKVTGDTVTVVTSFQKYLDKDGNERFMQLVVDLEYDYLKLKLA